jgi:MoxR-like ATPase
LAEEKKMDHHGPSLQASLASSLALAQEIIFGKAVALKRCLITILAGGHLLIEDIPGVGKTTLALFWAKVLGLPFSRIQLTSDLLPADIVGNLIYQREKDKFEIYRGPIFANLVLADELNRATPRTQSAFLQAMEEAAVAIDKEILPLPHPFVVFATQNPQQQVGTFMLPESQLDRFLLKIKIGMPDEEAEKKLLTSPPRRQVIEDLRPQFTREDVVQMQREVQQVKVAPAIIDLVEKILQQARHLPQAEASLGVINPPSPRAGLALIAAARAAAYIEGRDYVLPEDVQDLAFEVLGHRMFSPRAWHHPAAADFIKQLVESIAVR